MARKTNVLFLCTHNSVRSQIAEGLLQYRYGDRYDVYSAGVDPTEINPYAIEVLKELGIDISNNRSKSIEEFRDKTFDYVVTVCNHAKESCPFFPGRRVIHKGFEDPSLFRGDTEATLNKFREVRNKIKTWIEQIFKEDSK